MDRQAWIAITLCVIGLVAWQVYMVKHPASRAGEGARLAESSRWARLRRAGGDACSFADCRNAWLD